MPKLAIDNFRLGQRRDGALRDDKLYSMYTLKNWDIDYVDGRLQVRKGYDRWNDTELPGPATQLHHFRDLDNNTHLLGITDDKWYKIAETGSHTRLDTDDATARRPVESWYNRVLYGTDTGMRWTDHDAITDPTNNSYQLGIDKPANPPQVNEDNTFGNYSNIASQVPYAWPVIGYITAPQRVNVRDINPTTRQKAGMMVVFNVPAVVGSVGVYMLRAADDAITGSFRIKIYTNDGGTPSTTLADTNAESSWVNLGDLDSEEATFGPAMFHFPELIQFGAGTYWVVLEADQLYYDTYADFLTHLTRYDETHLGCVAYTDLGADPTVYGQSYDWDGATWNATGMEYGFAFGRPGTLYYDYVYTHYNSTHGIESRPSDHTRILLNSSLAGYIEGYTAPTDPQVDSVRLYRRELPNGSGPDEVEANITDTYKLVGEVSTGITIFYDIVGTELLVQELQTVDHYNLYETSDDGSGLRTTTITPNIAIRWKDRIWVAEANGNILYMSKILEEDGASGLVGDAKPDVFPLDNQLELTEAGGIIGASVLPNDQLAVYFSNGAVWVIWGANEPLNPPPDIGMRQVMTSGGLIAPAGYAHYKGLPVIMTREGLYRFAGLPNPEFLMETNHSIIDAIQDQYLDDSIVHVHGNEIWCLVDDDNDGNLETFMILDMQRDVPSRQIMDRAWRMYNYGVNINDFIPVLYATSTRSILAADAGSNYILELGLATDDNGNAISSEVTTHDMRAENLIMIYQMDMDAKYPSTAPTYTLTLTDHNDDTQSVAIAPSSSNDIRAHRKGIRLNSPVSMRASLLGTHTAQDELVSITLSAKGE